MMSVYVGWDVSTSMIGVCILHPDDRTDWYTIDLSPVDDLSGKYKLAYDGISGIFLENPELASAECTHVIEEKLSGFSKGFTTQNTLLKLAAMNAVCTFIIEKFSPKHTARYLPVTVKSATKLKVDKKTETKKEAAVKLVRQLCPSFPYKSKPKTKKAENKEGNWVTGVDDMADAYLLALTGRKKNGA